MSAAVRPRARSADGAFRVAIVGAGPRGTFALERVLHHLRSAGGTRDAVIDVFDPAPLPGAGAVYDPAQPEFLRMNFAADRIDLWSLESLAVPATEQLSFVAWRRRAGAGAQGVDAADAFPARALVGRYLADGFSLLRHHAPDGVTLTVRGRPIDRVSSVGARWRLESGGRSCGAYDAVLLTTGHGLSRSWSPGDSGSRGAPVFPVDTHLGPGRVSPGTTVAIRGFGLTFLDAALALTEGRGGAFERRDDDHPLLYVGSGEQVNRILPFSRTGRPLLAKPDPALADAIGGMAEIAAPKRQQLLDIRRPLDLLEDILPALATCAAEQLLTAHARPRHGEHERQSLLAAERWLRAAHDGEPLPGADTPQAEIAESVAVGAGMRPPGLMWALGQAWRDLYPALVARLGDAGLEDRDQPGLRRLETEMERIAFGPPAANATKLLALIAAGRVDLRYVAGGQVSTRSRRAWIERRGEVEPVDIVIDAVLDGPGPRQDGGGLLGALVADGHAHVPIGRRGLEVRRDGTCVRADGRLSHGLATIGRSTEDWVIGNDTLDRTLHPHLDAWARGIVARIVPRPAAAGSAPLTAGGVR